MVDRLEQKTGKPAVTSNQANIWAIFGKLGLADPIEGFGRLLSGPWPWARGWFRPLRGIDAGKDS